MMITEYEHCTLLWNYPVCLGLPHFNLIFEANPQKWLKRGITMSNPHMVVKLGQMFSGLFCKIAQYTRHGKKQFAQKY